MGGAAAVIGASLPFFRSSNEKRTHVAYQITDERGEVRLTRRITRMLCGAEFPAIHLTGAALAS